MEVEKGVASKNVGFLREVALFLDVGSISGSRWNIGRVRGVCRNWGIWIHEEEMECGVVVRVERGEVWRGRRWVPKNGRWEKLNRVGDKKLSRARRRRKKSFSCGNEQVACLQVTWTGEVLQGCDGEGQCCCDVKVARWGGPVEGNVLCIVTAHGCFN